MKEKKPSPEKTAPPRAIFVKNSVPLKTRFSSRERSEKVSTPAIIKKEAKPTLTRPLSNRPKTITYTANPVRAPKSEPQKIEDFGRGNTKTFETSHHSAALDAAILMQIDYHQERISSPSAAKTKAETKQTAKRRTTVNILSILKRVDPSKSFSEHKRLYKLPAPYKAPSLKRKIIAVNRPAYDPGKQKAENRRGSPLKTKTLHSRQAVPLISDRKKNYSVSIAVAARKILKKNAWNMESSPTPPERRESSIRTTQSNKLSRTPNFTGAAGMRKINGLRSDSNDKPQITLTMEQLPTSRKMPSKLSLIRVKRSSKNISILPGEKPRQKVNAPVMETVKKGELPSSLVSGAKKTRTSLSGRLPQAVMSEDKKKTGMTAFYPPRTLVKDNKKIPSSAWKLEMAGEEKNNIKRINKESLKNIALLTQGETQKKIHYDSFSTKTSFKRKALDRKIYKSFIVPPKQSKATWTTFLDNHFLNRNMVNEILLTSQETIWVGIEGGILKYNGYKWDFFQSAGNLPGEVVYSLAEAADGSFWVGTENGLVRLDRSGNRVLSSENLLADVYDIQVDRTGTVWAGTDSGLFRYSGDRWEAVKLPEKIMGTMINTIQEGYDGRIWIGTEKGLSVYDGEKWAHFDTDNGLIHNNVYSIAVDEKGNIWCGTEGGVTRFDGKHWQSYTTADGLSDNLVYTVKTDSRGNVWFGTGKGVCKFNNYRFTNYDRKDGLLGNNVYSIAVAGNGEYWFGTERGISRMMDIN